MQIHDCFPWLTCLPSSGLNSTAPNLTTLVEQLELRRVMPGPQGLLQIKDAKPTHFFPSQFTKGARRFLIIVAPEEKATFRVV
jgi:hypothetical protein